MSVSTVTNAPVSVSTPEDRRAGTSTAPGWVAFITNYHDGYVVNPKGEVVDYHKQEPRAALILTLTGMAEFRIEEAARLRAETLAAMRGANEAKNQARRDLWDEVRGDLENGDLTLKQAAERCGVQPATITGWLRGSRALSIAS